MPACNQQEKGTGALAAPGFGTRVERRDSGKGGVEGAERQVTVSDLGRAGWRTAPLLRPSACAELWPEPQDAQDEGWSARL